MPREVLTVWFGLTHTGKYRIIIDKKWPDETLFDFIDKSAAICVEAGLDNLRMILMEAEDA